jgi:transglutaminase-like putative cysteine protease
MVACGALALVVSGGLSLTLAALFGVLMIAAWKLEETRWQLSERIGLLVILLSLPLFYLDWKYETSSGEVRVGVGALAHLIIFLSTIKLLQIKADRDWLFLYLISFFETLLAAGLAASPLFFFALCLYVLCALSTIIAFEIRNAQRAVHIKETRFLVSTQYGLIRRFLKRQCASSNYGEARRLPIVASMLVALILAFALPIFFIAPRFGANAFARASNSSGANFVGFSNSVTLGDIGKLQQNNNVVMRVRVENNSQAKRARSLRWRGIALDYFDGHKWQKSTREISGVPRSERGIFLFDTVESTHDVTTQTFYVEPLDQPVLFAAPHAVAVQIATPFVYRDAENALYTRAHNSERISYTAYSDTAEPDATSLSADSLAYTPNFERYKRLPKNLDLRIKTLAQQIITQAEANNRYDAAQAIEAYLRDPKNYRYTLDLKAGGSDPLADFLFNIREGHCEYFATSMAVMLRTLGLATRIVNGFQMGEYNDAADVYTVRQRDAHSWVEVYFPATESWVTFDPTPAAGRPARESSGGLTGSINKYAEALEFVWMRYVVSYDRQQQRSLANSLRTNLNAYRGTLDARIQNLKKLALAWLPSLSGDAEDANVARSILFMRVLFPVIFGIALIAFFFARRKRYANLWHNWRLRGEKIEDGNSAVSFYNRMTTALAAHGLQRATSETPLEFATATGMPEALTLTRAYNHVRYGEQELPPTEIAQIETWLKTLEETKDSK